MHIEVKVHPYLAVIRLHLDWLHAHVLAVRSDECLIFPMLYMCMPSQQMGPTKIKRICRHVSYNVST